MDEKDLSLLYRPQVGIERDYRSDAVIARELPDTRTDEEKRVEASVPEIPGELDAAIQNSIEAGRKLMRIRNITSVMPPAMKDTVDDFIDTVLVWTGVTIDVLICTKEKEEELPEGERHEIQGTTVYGPRTVYRPTTAWQPEVPESSATQDTKPEVPELSASPDTKPEVPESSATQDTKPEEDISVATVSDETTAEPERADDEWPTMTSSGFVFDVIKNKDVWDLAHDQYLLECSTMQEDFAEEYNNVMEGYVYQLVSAMDEVGLDAPEYLNYEYEGETVAGVPTDYLHLNDIIVKNQDVINEYQDILRKTHDLYTTDAVLAAYDVASQKRIRYLKEKYKEEVAGNYIEMYDKNYLADARNEMEQHYIAARTNVYKLLHSMCQISKEMLDVQLKLAIAKCSLLAKEINIFAKKEYEAAGISDAATDLAQPSEAQTGSAVTETSGGKTADDPLTVGGGFGGAIGQGIKNTVSAAQQTVGTAG